MTPIDRVRRRYVFDPSMFDPPDQDEYAYCIYTFEIEGRVYDVRRYLDDPEEAHILSNVRNADEQALADARLIARHLVDEEGVRVVHRYNTKTGVFDRRVVPAD